VVADLPADARHGEPAGRAAAAGNEHRQFIPVNAYRTRDGFVFVAVGSDAQWRRLVATPMFAALDQETLATNEGRRASREELHAAIAAISEIQTTAELTQVLVGAAVPHAPITPIEGVMELPFIAPALLETSTPEGRRIRLPPPAVSTSYLEEQEGYLDFAPAYGEHTEAVLAEVGLTAAEVQRLRQGGVVA